MNIKGEIGSKEIAWFFIILIALVLVWGVIGGNVAQDTGISCDMGIGDTFCWTWHKNAIGEFQEGVKDFFDSKGS